MVEAHVAVEGVAVHLVDRTVHRQLCEVGADARTLCVGVTVHATHEHLVRRDAGAGDVVRRSERRLLDLREEVRGVLVQGHLADFVQRVVLV